LKGGEKHMIKKLAIAASAGALFLSTASPAFGFFPFFSNDELVIRNTNTTVTNLVTTKADTGDNSIHGKMVFGGSIKTGDAWAESGVQNSVNFTSVEGCGCFDDVTIRNRDTSVLNDVYTRADSGDNSIHGMIVGGFHSSGARIRTGDAGASALVMSDVNTTIVGGGLE